MKKFMSIGLFAAAAALPATLSADVVAAPTTTQVTQTGGFGGSASGSVPALGSINGGFAAGVAIAAVIILASGNNSSSDTR